VARGGFFPIPFLVGILVVAVSALVLRGSTLVGHSIGAPFGWGLPLVTVLVLFALGVGLATELAPNLRLDARAALGPLIGVAALSVVSVLVPYGAPVRVVGVATAVPLLLLSWRHRREALRTLRHGAGPLVICLVAIALSSAPSFRQGNWSAKAYFGNTDSYLWVSQARSFLDGPPAGSVGEHPDRLAYDRIEQQHWAVALPFGLAQLSWITGKDPVDLYEVLAAVVSCFVPLAVFFGARACIGWRWRSSLAAALAAACNASLLLASYISWQQQLAGTAFAFVAAVALRLALEPGRSRRMTVLAAVMAAASLSTYRMGFTPYLLASLGAVLVSYLATHRSRDAVSRSLATVRATVIPFIILAAPSLVGLLLGFRKFAALGVSTGFKKSFPPGNLAESIGLVPGAFGAAAIWITVATLLGIQVVALGLLLIRHQPPARSDFLAGATIFLVGAYLVLLASPLPPYASFKLLAYGTPFLLLVVVGIFELLRSRWFTVGLATVLASTVMASTVVAVAKGVQHSPSASELRGVEMATSALPQTAVIRIDIERPWDQAWAAYFLRGRRVSLGKPSYVFTAYGLRVPPGTYQHRLGQYVLRHGSGRDTLLRNHNAGLAELPRPNMSKRLEAPRQVSMRLTSSSS
jgi:hypothetical protein